MHRLDHVALRESQDRRRHRGREQQRLPCRRAAAKDAFDVGAETDVEHAVGFVEDDEADVVEADGAAREVVEDAAGRADDERTTAFEGVELLADALAAVDGDGAAIGMGREFGGLFGNLDDEFAGRRQDDALRAASAGVFLRQALKNGTRKAAVLPVPVCAWPMTSRPARASGIKAAWMGVGSE